MKNSKRIAAFAAAAMLGATVASAQIVPNLGTVRGQQSNDNEFSADAARRFVTAACTSDNHTVAATFIVHPSVADMTQLKKQPSPFMVQRNLDEMWRQVAGRLTSGDFGAAGASQNFLTALNQALPGFKAKAEQEAGGISFEVTKAPTYKQPVPGCAPPPAPAGIQDPGSLAVVDFALTDNDDEFFTGGAISLKRPVALSACTADTRTVAGRMLFQVSKSDVAKNGGDTSSLPGPAVIAAGLNAAWEKAVSAAGGSGAFGAAPSPAFVAALQKNVKEFTDALEQATGIHFRVLRGSYQAPAVPGCE